MNATSLRAAVATLALAAFLPATADAAPVVIDLSRVWEGTFNGPSVYEIGTDFMLPANFTNAKLEISFLSINDRGVALLNGTIVDNAGIFGPGDGAFTPLGSTTASPFTYTRGNGERNVLVTSGFVTGLNRFGVVVNDTGSGILGGYLLADQGSFLRVDARMTYTPGSRPPQPGGVIPEPATWAMMITGFGLVGGMMRRRGVATVSA